MKATPAWFIAPLLGLIGSAAPAASEETPQRIEAIVASVSAALSERRYEDIDKLAARMLQQRSRLPDGRWELPLVSGAVRTGLKEHDDVAWRARLAQMDDWIAHTPKDATPYLAKAALLVAYAADARGQGWASSVSEQDMATFQTRLAAAREVLESSRAISQASPDWYRTMQDVALGQGWSGHDYRALFDEAVRREPTFYDFYFNAAEYFLPRWHGNAGDVAKFVDAAVDRTKAKEGQTLYARIYWSLMWAYQDKTFAPGRAEWPRMRQGFKDMLHAYPDNWNANAFAYYACMAADWPTYRLARAQMSSLESGYSSLDPKPAVCDREAAASEAKTR